MCVEIGFSCGYRRNMQMTEGSVQALGMVSQENLMPATKTGIDIPPRLFVVPVHSINHHIGSSRHVIFPTIIITSYRQRGKNGSNKNL